MVYSELLNLFSLSPGFQRLKKSIERGERELFVSGLRGSAKSLLCASLGKNFGRPILTVVRDPEEAERLREDLSTFFPEGKIFYFPPLDLLPYEDGSPDIETRGNRFLALKALIDDPLGVIISIPLRALLKKLLSPTALRMGIIKLKVGERVDREAFLERLIEIGFERVPVVEEVGEMSVRGGIVDLFTFTHSQPLRLEFFGEELNSIREFDVVTQRSIAMQQEITILPKEETYLESFPLVNLLDYLPKEGIIIFDDFRALEEEATNFLEEVERHYRKAGEREGVLPPEELYSQFSEVQKKGENQSGITIIHLSEMRHETMKPDSTIELSTQLFELSPPNFSRLRQRLRDLDRKGYRTVILSNTLGEGERFAELLREGGEEGEHYFPSVSFLVGSLHTGFLFPEAKLAILTEKEFFQRQRYRRFRRFKGGKALRDLGSLKEGDYCVHVDYGIGQFAGLVKLDIEGRVYECLLLIYKDGDKLYVPIEEMKRVEIYVGEEGKPPPLTKLGTAAWGLAKQRAKKAIGDMARELLSLYAQRQMQKGFAFSPDSVWQKELEASFPYEETPDQLKAWEAIKRDLESPHPMDRLICGDVGYGKTEVAIRAAFKVVMDSKQVAVLVPTTVLAEQHYRTFTQRLAEYPIRVEMLSRFKKKEEQAKIVLGLKDGTVDIVIGTHRLLQKDVKFKDLGLVVIDEEQRFGVAHKEHLKKLRLAVDVLTLTATPIPRTLHMGLLGLRDMSNIETPPKDRLPIVTEIVEWREDLIEEAILREIERGGQVYFVHNRVQSIEAMASFLQRLLPQLRIGIAHGELPERELSQVMRKFWDREFEVLLSTTIIESGLDIPNVNTIIINRADRFGLAELYQLRGRVGRSNRRAYAYLLVPKDWKVTSLARKRLATLEELTDLGAGFKLALRDLEIRGAGNLLGREQHGHIVAVGFDLYCKLLEETVREFKGESPMEDFEPHLSFDMDVLIPDIYIEENSERLAIYKKLSLMRRLDQLKELREELRDRFGPLPLEVENLLEMVVLRILAKEVGLERIVLKDGSLELEYRRGLEPKPDRLQMMVRRMSRYSVEFFSQGKNPEKSALGIRFKIGGGLANVRIKVAQKILEKLKEERRIENA